MNNLLFLLNYRQAKKKNLSTSDAFRASLIGNIAGGTNAAVSTICTQTITKKKVAAIRAQITPQVNVTPEVGNAESPTATLPQPADMRDVFESVFGRHMLGLFGFHSSIMPRLIAAIRKESARIAREEQKKVCDDAAHMELLERTISSFPNERITGFIEQIIGRKLLESIGGVQKGLDLEKVRDEAVSLAVTAILEEAGKLTVSSSDAVTAAAISDIVICHLDKMLEKWQESSGAKSVVPEQQGKTEARKNKNHQENVVK